MNERHRKLNRLKNYDYSLAGCYFVTICIKDKQCLLGEVKDKKVSLNQYGEIINHSWNNIIDHYDNVFLYQYVIMPNHIHGIIVINNNLVGTEQRSVLHLSVRNTGNADVGTEQPACPRIPFYFFVL